MASPPLHSALVHFPIALLTSGLVWDALALFREEGFWWAFSFWNTALGLAMGLIAACFGTVDLLAIPPHKTGALRTASIHMSLVFLALLLYGLGLVAQGRPGNPVHLVPFLALEVSGFAALAVGGHFGGKLVFRHGIGQVE